MGAVGFTETDWIWKNGEWIGWNDAKLHLLATAVQFGTSVFEGVRAYDTPRGPAVFRLDAHMRRLMDSCKVYRMTPEYTQEALAEVCLEVVRKNGLKDCYVRPMVLRGYGAVGLNPFNSPIDTYVATWPWGAYLGEDAIQNGVDVCTSSWQRAYPNTLPTAAKAGGHYVSAQLMKMEAITNGYADAIALSPSGLVSEGSGMNVFMVRDGVVITPFLDGTSLHGITRASVMEMARRLGYEVVEGMVSRESIYTADEVFFSGTAAEVTPVNSIDRIVVGAGGAGPVTKALQAEFWATVRGENDDPYGYLTYVDG